MSDSKIGSINKYSIGNVSKISTNTSIMKRPYDSASSYSDKKDNNSKSSKRPLKSSDDQTNDFTNLLSNELNDRLILDSRETLRVIHTNFDSTHSDETNSNLKADSPALHSKLRDAMHVEVDTSELYKKLQLLNTLK